MKVLSAAAKKDYMDSLCEQGRAIVQRCLSLQGSEVYYIQVQLYEQHLEECAGCCIADYVATEKLNPTTGYWVARPESHHRVGFREASEMPT